jgi:syntaxin-binding protein 5
VAYVQKSVVIVDLRGPDVILREGFTEDGLKVKRKKKGSQNVPADSSQCVTLKWTICRLGGDQGLAPRLVLGYARGYVTRVSLTVLV